MRRVQLSLKEKAIAFLGGGHITEIIIENLIKTEVVSKESLIVSDPDNERREKLSQKFSIRVTEDNTEAVQKGDIAFFNVRPQVIGEVLDELSLIPISLNKIFVALAAGIPIERYNKLGRKRPIIRSLPNPPCQIGQAITAVAFNEYVNDDLQKEILTLFRALGEVVIMEEKSINAATALSSPVTVFLFFQALIDAGIQSGLDKETSTKIAYQTIYGAMEVWRQRNISPSLLIDESCTPGGISVEILSTLDQYDLRAGITDAIQNATLKADFLSETE